MSNNTNKETHRNIFVFRIRLIGECKLIVDVIYLDKKFSTKYSKDGGMLNFPYYSTKDEFVFYCDNNGFIVNDMFVIPETTKRRDGIKSVEHSFTSDTERKKYLRVLYDSLIEFANNWHGFIPYNLPKRNRINLNNEFWIY